MPLPIRSARSGRNPHDAIPCLGKVWSGSYCRRFDRERRRFPTTKPATSANKVQTERTGSRRLGLSSASGLVARSLTNSCAASVVSGVASARLRRALFSALLERVTSTPKSTTMAEYYIQIMSTAKDPAAPNTELRLLLPK